MSNITRPSYTVQLMRPEDDDQIIEILSSFGWWLCKYEPTLSRSADANGCFVAKENETGKVLGLCTGLIHSDSFAYVGLYGVRKEYQRLGIGQAIWRRVIQHLEPEKRNLALIAGPSILPIYRDKLGFALVSEKRLQKYSGRADTSKLQSTIDGLSIVSVQPSNIDAVVDYDADVCAGLDRRKWLTTAMNLPETVFLTAISQKDCQVKGCCMLTTTNIRTAQFYQLYADDSQIAECLLFAACQQLLIATTVGLHMQGWDCNENTEKLAKKIKLEMDSSIDQIDKRILFTKQIIHGKMEKIFNVSSMRAYPF